MSKLVVDRQQSTRRLVEIDVAERGSERLDPRSAGLDPLRDRFQIDLVG